MHLVRIMQCYSACDADAGSNGDNRVSLGTCGAISSVQAANPTAVHAAVPLIFRDDGKRIRPDRKNTGTVTVS